MELWVKLLEYINMTPEVKTMKDSSGNLLFVQSHTLMLVATIEALSVFVENAENAAKLAHKSAFQPKIVQSLATAKWPRN